MCRLGLRHHILQAERRDQVAVRPVRAYRRHLSLEAHARRARAACELELVPDFAKDFASAAAAAAQRRAPDRAVPRARRSPLARALAVLAICRPSC